MKYALFDCDGTLMDSMPMWVNLSLDVMREDYGIEVPREVERQTASMSFSEASQYLADNYLDGKGAKELEEKFAETLEYNYREVLELKPHVLDMLQAMKAREIPMAIASSTDEYLLKMALERLGLMDYFRFIQTVDNTGFSKNSDEYFQKAAEQFGCSMGDIIFFDDALYALERAKSNGLTIVAVQDDTNEDQADIISRVGDTYINDFSEFDIDKWF